MGGNRPSPVLQLFPLGKTMSWVEARIGTGREQGQVTAFQLATGWSPLARRHLSVLQPCAQQPGYLAASSSRKLATLLPLWDRGNGLSPHPTPQPTLKRVPTSTGGSEEGDCWSRAGFHLIYLCLSRALHKKDAQNMFIWTTNYSQNFVTNLLQTKYLFPLSLSFQVCQVEMLITILVFLCWDWNEILHLNTIWEL